jgi:hypothetical protein
VQVDPDAINLSGAKCFQILHVFEIRERNDLEFQKRDISLPQSEIRGPNNAGGGRLS